VSVCTPCSLNAGDDSQILRAVITTRPKASLTVHYLSSVYLTLTRSCHFEFLALLLNLWGDDLKNLIWPTHLGISLRPTLVLSIKIFNNLKETKSPIQSNEYESFLFFPKN
jgi:hypothetical protein